MVVILEKVSTLRFEYVEVREGVTPLAPSPTTTKCNALFDSEEKWEWTGRSDRDTQNCWEDVKCSCTCNKKACGVEACPVWADKDDDGCFRMTETLKGGTDDTIRELECPEGFTKVLDGDDMFCDKDVECEKDLISGGKPIGETCPCRYKMTAGCEKPEKGPVRGVCITPGEKPKPVLERVSVKPEEHCPAESWPEEDECVRHMDCGAPEFTEKDLIKMATCGPQRKHRISSMFEILDKTLNRLTKYAIFKTSGIYNKETEAFDAQNYEEYEQHRTTRTTLEEKMDKRTGCAATCIGLFVKFSECVNATLTVKECTSGGVAEKGAKMSYYAAKDPKGKKKTEFEIKKSDNFKTLMTDALKTFRIMNNVTKKETWNGHYEWLSSFERNSQTKIHDVCHQLFPSRIAVSKASEIAPDRAQREELYQRSNTGFAQRARDKDDDMKGGAMSCREAYCKHAMGTSLFPPEDLQPTRPLPFSLRECLAACGKKFVIDGEPRDKWSGEIREFQDDMQDCYETDPGWKTKIQKVRGECWEYKETSLGGCPKKKTPLQDQCIIATPCKKQVNK